MHGPCTPSRLWQGRANTATKYNIEEDGIMSFALSCLCPACTLVQVVNQARHDPTRYAPAMHLPAISPPSPYGPWAAPVPCSDVHS